MPMCYLQRRKRTIILPSSSTGRSENNSYRMVKCDTASKVPMITKRWETLVDMVPSDTSQKVKRMIMVEHSGTRGVLKHEGLRSSKLEALADCPIMPDPSLRMGSAVNPNEPKPPLFLRALGTLLKWVQKASQYEEKAGSPSHISHCLLARTPKLEI